MWNNQDTNFAIQIYIIVRVFEKKIVNIDFIDNLFARQSLKIQKYSKILIFFSFDINLKVA